MFLPWIGLWNSKRHACVWMCFKCVVFRSKADTLQKKTWAGFKSELARPMISMLTIMSKPKCYLNPKSTFKSWVRHQTGCPHRVELPEIRLKYLNPSSLCLSCSHQESWLPPAAAAAMWEELSTSKGCPRPAKAESPSLPSSRSLPSSHMRTRRWLSPAGSPSMSWRSSSSCCPLQVCHINCVLISESAFLAIKTPSFIINRGKVSGWA